jgi:hypothetical protein
MRKNEFEVLSLIAASQPILYDLFILSFAFYADVHCDLKLLQYLTSTVHGTKTRTYCVQDSSSDALPKFILVIINE